MGTLLTAVVKKILLWNAGHFFKLAIFFDKKISLSFCRQIAQLKLPACGQSLSLSRMLKVPNQGISILTTPGFCTLTMVGPIQSLLKFLGPILRRKLVLHKNWAIGYCKWSFIVFVPADQQHLSFPIILTGVPAISKGTNLITLFSYNWWLLCRWQFNPGQFNTSKFKWPSV